MIQSILFTYGFFVRQNVYYHHISVRIAHCDKPKLYESKIKGCGGGFIVIQQTVIPSTFIILPLSFIMIPMSDTPTAIVTHHSPDLDAITATWLLKRFDAQHFATAKILFANPGEQLSNAELELNELKHENITYVDTGLGEFDHHQEDRGQQYLSAALLVWQHLTKLHPEIIDDKALKTIVDYATEIDHFKEIFWPDADNLRYNFMIQELIDGMSKTNLHDDDSLMHFGFDCLESAYANLTQTIKARDLIEQRASQFQIKDIKALTIETENDDVIKEAQKQGFSLVVKRDPTLGHIRIKVRPDCQIDLKPLSEKISITGDNGTWYYHPSGKMLLNGSSKHRGQAPTQLTIEQIVSMIKETYG